MGDENHLLLRNSFIFRGNKNVELFSSRFPESNDNSRLCDFINQFFPSNMTVASLLEAIERDHFELKKNFYIVHRKVVIVPKLEPENPIERVQLVKDLLQHTFEPSFLLKNSQEFQPADQSLSPYQKYVISLTFSHFHKLLASNVVYTKKEEQDEFVKAIFHFFTPDVLELHSARIVSQSNFKNKLVTITSPNSALIDNEQYSISDDPNDLPLILYQNTLPLKSKTGQSIKVKLSGITPFQLQEALSSRPNSYNTIHSLCQQDFKNDQQFLDALKISLLTLDTRFLQTIFPVISPKSTTFNDLQILYTYFGQDLFYFKQLAYMELYNTVDLNAIFRQNTNYIRALNQLVKEECENYFNEVSPKLLDIISRNPVISIEKAKEQDAVKADQMIKEFFQILIDSVPKIPPKIRLLVRFMRILSEILWLNPDLIYRSTFSIFILRYLIPTLSQIPGDDIKTTAKVVQFTKLIAKVGQMTVLDNSLMNRVINNNFGEAIRFYEEMIKIPHETQVHKNISQKEAIVAAKNLKQFILENKDELLLEAPKKSNSHTNIFIDEYLSEIIARSK